MTTEPLRWRKSSRSNTQTDCVMLPHTLDAVRDSKAPEGPVLPAPGLRAFLRQIQDGQFDR